MSRMVQTGGAVLWEPDKSRPGEGASERPGRLRRADRGGRGGADPAAVTADLPGGTGVRAAREPAGP